MNKVFIRREKIAEEVAKAGIISPKEIAKNLNVSYATIKRDLIVLEEEKKILRARGSVVPAHTDSSLPQFEKRVKANRAAKEVIAMKAASMIEDNDVIFMDSGTTILSILKYINRKNITIFTNSIPIVMEAVEEEYDLDINILPGKVLKGHMTICGLATANEIDGLYFDKCFLSAPYLNFDYGVLDERLDNKLIKQKLVSHCKTVILCADSSKLKGWEMMKCIPYSNINYWITDRYLENDLYRSIKEYGVEIFREG
ncbi:MAG: DeoR/GlpR transcriptional regulator [Erysipelotrichaceae bacterium]|nr:DeoR/GlpR transcriptional regulator [Erysipelotrichaceae bacterium]